MFWRSIALVAIVYVASALAGLAKERRGLITCECRDDCWCKRPGLAMFRWVFPVGHNLG